MRSSLIILITGALIGAMNLHRVRPLPPTATASPDWPIEFEGRPLEPLPPSATEKAFATSFPGAIGVFRSPGNRQVILRQVDRATRRLHDSATCLKAAGFSLDGRTVEGGWVRYRARRGTDTFDVREQISAGEQVWTDVSAWFWHASFYPNSGPWMAVTVLDLR